MSDHFTELEIVPVKARLGNDRRWEVVAQANHPEHLPFSPPDADAMWAVCGRRASDTQKEVIAVYPLPGDAARLVGGLTGQDVRALSSRQAFRVSLSAQQKAIAWIREIADMELADPSFEPLGPSDYETLAHDIQREAAALRRKLSTAWGAGGPSAPFIEIAPPCADGDHASENEPELTEFASVPGMR